MIKKLTIFCLGLFVSSRSSASLGLNDLSILMPFPETKEEIALMLKASSSGPMGEILSEEDYNKLPGFPANFYPNLNVLAIRIDPCFPDLSLNENGCEKQIRMVVQPLQLDSTEKPISPDSPIHLFFSLNKNSFDAFLLEYESFTRRVPSNIDIPLQVNPQLHSQGYSSDYFEKFKSIFLKYVGKVNLTKIATMPFTTGGNKWLFQKFERNEKGDFFPAPIPTLNGANKQFVDSAPAPNERQFSASPMTFSNDNISLFFHQKTALVQPLDVIRRGLDASYRIENPKIHNPTTIDCVSCHLVTPLRSWIEKNINTTPFNPQNIFESAFNLQLTTEPLSTNTSLLRNFGYLRNKPFVSQRTVNETAAIAEYLSKRNRSSTDEHNSPNQEKRVE